MNYLIILLRLVHILGAIFWVGGSLMLTLYVGPAIASDPQGSQKVLQYLMGKARLSARIMAAAGLSILAGAILYLLDSDAFRSAWTTSGPGIGFALGAVFAMVGFGAGVRLGRNNKELATLGAQIQGQPAAEQVARLAAIQKSTATLTPINVIGLILAALFMAPARYFTF